MILVCLQPDGLRQEIRQRTDRGIYPRVPGPGRRIGEAFCDLPRTVIEGNTGVKGKENTKLVGSITRLA